MRKFDYLPEPDLRWPVFVTVHETYLLWVAGTSSQDAAARLNRRDPVANHEEATRTDAVGGGVRCDAPDAYDDVYDEYTDVGPSLSDGSFWGPGERSHWAK